MNEENQVLQVQQDDENKIFISRGRKFYIGINHVPKERILLWRQEDEIDWPAFLWYISQHVYLTDYGDDWLEIYLEKKRKLTQFYKNSINYKPRLHKKVYQRNKANITKKIKQIANPGFTALEIRMRILLINSDPD